MGRPTPWASAERPGQASGGGIWGMGSANSGGVGAAAARSPIAASSSSRALPSCTSVARAVLKARPLRSSWVSIWQGWPDNPGRR